MLFDPLNTPFQQVAQALLRARHNNQHVLIHIGGDWCSWCLLLEEVISNDEALLHLRATHYVTVPLFVPQSGPNDEIFAYLPRISSAPHLFILNRYGDLICSQTSESMEVEETYDIERVKHMLIAYALPNAPVLEVETRIAFRNRLLHYHTRIRYLESCYIQ